MSDLKLKGTIKEILKVQGGTSKSTGNEWQKLVFAIANNDGYEGKEVVHAFELFGKEKVENFIKYNKVGSLVEVSYNQESKRWESPGGDIRYFTTNSAESVWASTETPKEIQQTAEVEDGLNDLPFKTVVN